MYSRAGDGSPDIEAGVHTRQTCVSEREIRIERDCLLEVSQANARRAVTPHQHWIAAAQVQLVGDHVRGTTTARSRCNVREPRRTSRRRGGDCRADRRRPSHHRQCDDQQRDADRAGGDQRADVLLARCRRSGSCAIEVIEEFGGSLRAPIRLLRETTGNQIGDRKSIRADVGDWPRPFIEVRGDDAMLRRIREWRCPGQHLVRDAAERVDVDAVIDLWITDRLFRCHVRRGADSGAHVGYVVVRTIAGSRRIDERLGDAEVGDHRRAAGEEHVSRLDVAMHNATTVRVRQSAGDVLHDAECFAERQRTVANQPLA